LFSSPSEPYTTAPSLQRQPSYYNK
jgi:hypothetical protein